MSVKVRGGLRRGAGTDPCLAQVGGLVVAAENVLVDVTGWRRCLFQLLCRLGVHSHYDLLFRVWDCDFVPLMRSQKYSLSCALQQFLRAMGLSRGQVGEVLLALRSKHKRALANPRPLAGAISTMQRLRSAGVRMSVTCLEKAWDIDWTRLLVRAGLRTYFEEVWDGSSACHWLDSVRRFDLTAHEVAFVGTQGWQLMEARSAGLETISIGEGGAPHHSLEYIDRLPELLGLQPAEMPASRKRVA